MAGLYKPIAYRNTSGAGRRTGTKLGFGWMTPKKTSGFAKRYGIPATPKPRRVSVGSKPPVVRLGRRSLGSASRLGAPVRAGGYGSGFRRGTSQSTGMVATHGLVWGGRVFKNRAQFGASLKAHGSSLATFQKRHSNAFKGLSSGKAVSRSKNGLTVTRTRSVGP